MRHYKHIAPEEREKILLLHSQNCIMTYIDLRALAEISQQSLVSYLGILWITILLPYRLKRHMKLAERTAVLSISSLTQ